MQKFCKDNIDVLNKKRVGIFLCCAFSEQIKEYLAANFTPALLKSTIVVKGFGAEARIDKMKFMDKLIMKAALKGGNETLHISCKNMDSFIEELNAR